MQFNVLVLDLQHVRRRRTDILHVFIKRKAGDIAKVVKLIHPKITAFKNGIALSDYFATASSRKFSPPTAGLYRRANMESLLMP